MKCPRCNQAKQGRDVKLREQCEVDIALHQQRRTRRCLECGHGWDTLEVPIDEVIRLRRAAHAMVMAGLAERDKRVKR